MPSEAERVKRYFEGYATGFDRIYDQAHPSLWKAFDRWRHRSMFERLRLTLEACGDVRGKRILDVGCGSGRYSVGLARRGATVVGIDLSAPMIELANRAAQQAQVASRCQFLVGDVLQLPLEGPFDFSLAIGVFDYTSDPTPILEKMRRLTRGRLIGSFPVRDHPLSGIRKLRLWLAGCPVFFYTPQRVKLLLAWSNSRLSLHPLGRDVLAIVDFGAAPARGEAMG